MSSCIEELYDYDLIKKCSKCGIISLKSNFHKDNKRNDGLFNRCKVCRKDYYLQNRNRIKDYYLQNRDRIKEYQFKNHDKINTQQRKYKNNRYKTDINYRLICITRSRIRQALNRKTKSYSTIDILGIDIETYRKWIQWQMTPDMTWDNIEIDHVRPISSFDISDEEQLKEAFNWKNTQPSIKEVHSHKGIKFNFLDYQLQFIKAYQFIKLNEERFNENVH